MWWTFFYVVLTVSLAYFCKITFFSPPKNLHGVYNGKGLALIYWWRWFWLVCEVWIEQLFTNPRMNDHDSSWSSSYYTCGVQATPSEQELELPKPLVTDRHEDSMQLFGMDSEGRAVVARVVRMTQRRSSVILMVVDKNGDVYTLPNQPDTNLVNVTDVGWKAGGISLQCVEPMRCWRLKFNGLLRRGKREEYITEDDKDRDEENIIHARLDFLWKAIRAPVDVWRDASPRLLAHGLANRHRSSRSMFSLVDNISIEHDEYQQWGSLHGEVRLGGQTNAPPQEWYLRGCRRHSWGLIKAIANFHRSVEIVSYFVNGDVCSLQACSYGNKISHYVLGYLQKASGVYHPITSTDLCLPNLAEDGVLPHNVLIEFCAGGQKYNLWHKLGQGMTYHTGDPWYLTHKVNFNSAAATHSHGWGISIFSDKFNDLCPVPEQECLPPLEEPSIEVDEGSPLAVSISDYLCRATSLTGGKGASLGQLTMLKDVSYHPFEVPGGLVVTVSAWRQQLKTYCDLQYAVRGIEQAVGSSNQQQLKDACARAVETFKNATICREVETALKDAIEEEFEGGIKGRRFAVRSSGCAEDGEETSAAGQNETLLGVEGIDNILRALATCWASQFTFQSVEYRRQHGQVVNGGMGVVVQEMINAEVAGVLFTLDPVTGSPANITIAANYGLGESVVSASADPDTVLVHRTWRDHLSVATETRGAKKTKCIINESGGTSEVNVNDTEREQICISNDLALRLAHVAVYLQKAYGSPRDIEFAVAEDVVYLLQARPITGLDAWTDFELIHEQDNSLLTDHELLTTANTGEVFPGITSPLTISIIPPILNVGFQKVLLRSRWPFYKLDPHCLKLCPSFCRHIFLNMIEIQYRDNQPEVSPVNHAIDMGVHGRPVSTPQFVEYGKERFGIINKLASFRAIVCLLYDKLTSASRIKHARNQFKKFTIGENRAVSAESLYNEITRRIPDLLEISTDHVKTSTVSSSSQAIALVLLAEGKNELNQKNHADMANLLASCVGVESADVPSALKNVARVIDENEEVNDFLGMTYEEGKVWLESHPGLVGREFRSFLEKHGHRCVKELDLCSLSWSLDPRPLIESLQRMVGHLTDNRVKEDISIEQAINSLQTEVKESTKRALRFLLPLCREAVVNREATKSILTKVIDGFRKAYLKLGQLMVSEARLPEADLIFFLKHQEIEQLISNRSPALISKAIRRKKQNPQLDNLRYPGISIGLPKPISVTNSAEISSEGPDLVITGTPVCQGVVTAKARVVTKLAEASTIKNGDVLVTICTDVGWTPYFPLLSGVITEIGGLISHGAVVAREYGLPCVVGATDATQLLKSGDNIVLNATEGTITRLGEHNDDKNSANEV